MAEHGTRTMYNHYGCRCEACCRAEHQQYLKRKRTVARERYNSKWADEYIVHEVKDSAVEKKRQIQRIHNANRYKAFKERPSTHAHRIVWREIANAFNMRCAICGCVVDSNDFWVGSDGLKRYGRKYPTVDHIIPLKHGGTDTLDNVQLTCKHCNSSKGAKIENVVV